MGITKHRVGLEFEFEFEFELDIVFTQFGEILVCCEFKFGVFLCDVTELTTALECQKPLLMSSISNLGGRESLEIAVTIRLFYRVYQKKVYSWKILAKLTST